MEAVLLKVERFCLLRGKLFLKNNNTKPFSTSNFNYLDFKWRRERGLPENPNTFGPLTNLPDFTYVDGRPTPLGANQKKRLMKQRGYAETIVRLTKEVDFAVERYERIKREVEERQQKIMDSKLKPKGKRTL